MSQLQLNLTSSTSKVTLQLQCLYLHQWSTEQVTRSALTDSWLWCHDCVWRGELTLTDNCASFFPCQACVWWHTHTVSLAGLCHLQHPVPPNWTAEGVYFHSVQRKCYSNYGSMIHLKVTVFWHVAACSLTGRYQCFGGICCNHLRGWRARLVSNSGVDNGRVMTGVGALEGNIHDSHKLKTDRLLKQDITMSREPGSRQ
jgi:hypothetical protein